MAAISAAIALLAIAGLIVVVPIAVIFVCCQRFLVKGILVGSVKS